MTQVTIQDVRDMLGGCIPARDVEEILVQAYNFTADNAKAILKEAMSTQIKNIWGRSVC